MSSQPAPASSAVNPPVSPEPQSFPISQRGEPAMIDPVLIGLAALAAIVVFVSAVTIHSNRKWDEARRVMEACRKAIEAVDPDPKNPLPKPLENGASAAVELNLFPDGLHFFSVADFKYYDQSDPATGRNVEAHPNKAGRKYCIEIVSKGPSAEDKPGTIRAESPVGTARLYADGTFEGPR